MAEYGTLISLLGESEAFQEAASALQKDGTLAQVSGLTGAQQAHFALAAARRLNRPLLLLCENEKAAARVLEDITALGGGPAALFPAREITFYQDVAASRDVVNRRLEALHRVVSGEVRTLVLPVDALLHRLMPRRLFEARTLRLAPGDTISIEALCRALQAAGYSRENMVEGRGQFASRGGIVDVYPVSGASALRLDFFDDELDMIRGFDVLTQRSTQNLGEAVIPPACETPAPEDCAAAANRLRAILESRQDKTASATQAKPEGEIQEEEDAEEDALPDGSRGAQRFTEKLTEAVAQMEAGEGVRFAERFIHLVYEQTETLLDYLPGALAVLCEPDGLRERIESRRAEFDQAYTAALERGEAVRQQEHLLLTAEELDNLLAGQRRLEVSSIQRAAGRHPADARCDMGGVPIGSYGGRIGDMCRDVRNWLDAGWRVLVLSGGSARGERMRQSFEDEGIPAAFRETPKLQGDGTLEICPSTLSGGFQYPGLRLAVLVESDVYGNKRQTGRRRGKKEGRLNAFTDLAVGDYVVHETHGIGVYEGIKRLTSEGTSRDYLMVQYLGSDKLYIPVDHFDRIQKYIGGGEGTAPRLSRLGGKEWDRQKSRMRESLKTLAFELVALYAERQRQQGHAFAADTPWQQEFEENFPYEETPDQLQAVQEIKEDMQSARPMDRLLCGDVGYGKTEVALRAAFKAVMDGYQVAILAPTTILAQQHYNTLVRRFEGFPVHAEVLSRFRTAKQQKDILSKLERGEIDVIVGTHRLLAKDVRYRKLGLLIVDEEQRFGVGHKEAIKNLKKTIDVLTLSATPIPRTLHMSMIGIRDMSLLETPPQARYPVQTYVIEYQDSVIRDAILREMHRGGQTFFLYNRVNSIERCYAELTRLVPEARIAIAHGQMRENVLEDVMQDFSDQKFDVLLCTTIIESGLDIPNANTLIILDADHFGLGQLYQMRGRVGRSNRLAYAYFTVRGGRALSETAQKRLDTIREFTEFGSGFRIAMRDLELRGAGNVLGPQQSGHLADIGYDLYCKLLDEAVLEAKGEAPAARDLETRMDVHVNAYLPADYVTGDRQRLEVYRRIAGITTAAQRDDVEEELVDRFGEEPVCVANLVTVAYLKALAGGLGVERVLQKRGSVELIFSPAAQLDGARLFAAVMNLDRRLVLRNAPRPMLVVLDKNAGEEELLSLTLRLIERLTARMQEAA